MTLENKIQRYIDNNDWNINYNDGEVKTIWGTKYDVRIDKNNDCLSLLGTNNPIDETITLREPCKERVEFTLTESTTEAMAYTLAHELGHADTWALSAAIPYGIMIPAIALSIYKKSLRPISLGALLTLGHELFIDELIAETATTLFHKAPFMRSIYNSLPNIEKCREEIMNVL